MSTDETLIERLNNEADQCRNDGADDIANLLGEAVAALEAKAKPISGIEEDVKALQLTLADVPPEQWEACGFDVRTIRTDAGGGFAVADCTNSPRSGDDTSALARFIAAANPDRIARLLSALEEAEKDRRTISQADVSKAARFICDRSARECNVDKGDMWKLHGSEFAEDVADMLAHIGFDVEPAPALAGR